MRGKIIPLSVAIFSSIPKETKKSMEKKSFNGVILPSISNLYGNDARLIPAAKAPMAIENPGKSIWAMPSGTSMKTDSSMINIFPILLNNIEKKKHTESAIMKRSS